VFFGLLFIAVSLFIPYSFLFWGAYRDLMVTKVLGTIIGVSFMAAMAICFWSLAIMIFWSRIDDPGPFERREEGR
jgi:hypothetical protein